VAISTSLGCNIADYTFSDINTKDTVDTVYPEYDIEQDVPLETPDTSHQPPVTSHQTPDTPVSCQVRIRGGVGGETDAGFRGNILKTNFLLLNSIL